MLEIELNSQVTDHTALAAEESFNKLAGAAEQLYKQGDLWTQ